MSAASSPLVQETPLLRGIGQIAVRAGDLPRAVVFYRDRLGLTYLFEAPGLAFFECGGIHLMLSGAETPEFDHAASVLYFDVAEIASAHRTLSDRGVHFRDEPHVVHRAGDRALWMAFFDDSEGNVFAIRQWRSAA
jgi:catechol 2,3-dioxygenase-like lactoylglutathione lyase family enzyme